MHRPEVAPTWSPDAKIFFSSMCQHSTTLGPPQLAVSDTSTGQEG